MGMHEKEWANAIGLVGLFRVKWKPQCHKLLVEFLSIEKEKNNFFFFFSRIGKKAIVINKYILGEMFKSSTKWLKEEK